MHEFGSPSLSLTHMESTEVATNQTLANTVAQPSNKVSVRTHLLQDCILCCVCSWKSLVF